MGPKLTLHHGEQQASCAEHPTEIARKQLLQAAELESDDWNAVLRPFASALPRRSPVRKAD